MAWLSVGSTNTDLINKMREHGVLKGDSPLLQSFFRTDRGDFVHDEDRIAAYQDRPYKRGSIHISAPHMYVTVLDALSLQPGQSFLNVGSGSGYLSCLAASLLGPNGVSHGIEISESNVSFSLRSVQKWKQKNADLYTKQEVVSIVHGNCFDIDIEASSHCCRYDRIYVGAGCPEQRKEFFYHLLAVGGSLVMPVDERNQLIKVVRLSPTLFSTTHVSYVHFAPLLETALHEDEVLQLCPTNGPASDQVSHLYLHLMQSADPGTITVFKRPLPKTKRNKIQLPMLLWAPEKFRHSQFPAEYRHMVRLILMAANRWSSPLPGSSCCNYNNNQKSVMLSRVSCSTLPVAVWFYVFSFANRDWFKQTLSDVDVLQCELTMERQIRTRLEKQLEEAERARRIAERERDLYKIAMTRSVLPASHYYAEDPIQSTTSGEEDNSDLPDEESDSDNNASIMDDVPLFATAVNSTDNVYGNGGTSPSGVIGNVTEIEDGVDDGRDGDHHQLVNSYHPMTAMDYFSGFSIGEGEADEYEEIEDEDEDEDEEGRLLEEDMDDFASSSSNDSGEANDEPRLGCISSVQQQLPVSVCIANKSK